MLVPRHPKAISRAACGSFQSHRNLAEASRLPKANSKPRKLQSEYMLQYSTFAIDSGTNDALLLKPSLGALVKRRRQLPRRDPSGSEVRAVPSPPLSPTEHAFVVTIH